ncbi:GrpB family protein [Candidatus Saccharibacteria bacterium]|nr:GrpB family protein [Candidatus Saccharibacteria bacterium]
MSEKIFHLQPWNPALVTTAHKVTRQIHALAPELEVLFMGAAALALPGKNDIDLDILCDAHDVSKYAALLAPVLGELKELNDKTASWSTTIDGFKVDAILSDPTISHVPKQQAIFHKLKANAKLRDHYRQLKESCDGKPYKEYEQHKKAFFEQVYNSN